MPPSGEPTIKRKTLAGGQYFAGQLPGTLIAPEP